MQKVQEHSHIPPRGGIKMTKADLYLLDAVEQWFKYNDTLTRSQFGLLREAVTRAHLGQRYEPKED